MKKYQVIYADPPWPETSESMIPNKHRRTQQALLDARKHFNTLLIPEIMAFRVIDIAEPNSALFLWSTARHLPDALMVMQHWGFRYVNMAFVWMKCNTVSHTPTFGLGYYTKQNAEFCLLGIRGSFKPVNFTVNSAIYEPRTRTFEKPQSVRAGIETLYGNVTRVELFARKKYKGWDSWGNQIKSDIKL